MRDYPHGIRCLKALAGAEGLEPSARGFVRFPAFFLFPAAAHSKGHTSVLYRGQEAACFILQCQKHRFDSVIDLAGQPP